MKKIKLISPAKVNLTLDVIKKTKSNFHEIRSIMMPIELHDTITIGLLPQKNTVPNKKSTPNITIKTVGLPCPQGSENSIHRAAMLFCEAAKIRPVIKITLTKRIPLASGLGGGSSNAATTLIGLNKLFDNPLTTKKLINIARKIGMDTPFFLNPTISLVTHFGEKVIPIHRKNSTPLKVVLTAQKQTKKSSAHAYGKLNLSLCNKQKGLTSKLLNFLKNSPLSWDSEWNNLLHNDFTQLYEAKPKNTYLTGSGPAQFKIVMPR